MSTEQEQRLGDPYSAPPVSPAASEAASPSPQPPTRSADPNQRERRPGDSGLGDPEPAPQVMRTLSPEETQRHEQQEAEELRAKFDAKLQELADADRGWQLPRPIRTAATWTLIMLASVLGLVMVSQAVALVNSIQQLPLWAQYLAGGGAILFGVALLYVIVRLFGMIVLLNRSPRINVKALAVLAERQQMQQLVKQRQEEARKLLVKYVKDYPLDEKGVRALRAAGVRDDELTQLQASRKRLIDADRPLSAGDWLDEFAGAFQGIVDKAAARRVRQYSRRVGAGTAISPVAFIDQMIVLYACAAMVKDLLLMYHLRPAFGQTAIIIARGIVHTYLSGMFEEVTESAADGAADWLTEGASTLGGTIGRALSAKAAEAALNGLLLWRLGRRVSILVAPVVR